MLHVLSSMNISSKKLYGNILQGVVKRSWHGRCRVGNRDIVFFGVNGSCNYQDTSIHPFPAVRFMENTDEVLCLRELEKGDWKCLSIEDKKGLYRSSYCQTFAEFKAGTGQWKQTVGWGLGLMSFAFWNMIFFKLFVYGDLPETFSEERREAQLRRMLDMHVGPVTGLSSNWDYEQECWT